MYLFKMVLRIKKKQFIFKKKKVKKQNKPNSPVNIDSSLYTFIPSIKIPSAQISIPGFIITMSPTTKLDYSISESTPFLIILINFY